MIGTVDIESRMEGRWVLQTFKRTPDGEEYGRKTVAEFHNLILNSGLDAVGQGQQYLRYCRVGTNSAAPVATQSSLGAQVAVTESKVSAHSNLGSTPYYTALTNTWRFTAGQAQGNLTEIGVGWGETGSTLFSRALILDGSGNPTTLPVQADEFLDAIYELRIYPPLTTATGTVTLSGSGDHNYTMRGANINLTDPWHWTTDTGGPKGGGRYLPAGIPGYAHDAPIGTNLEAPGGNQSQANTYTDQPYTPGSYYRDFILAWELNYGNFEDGIESVQFATGFGLHQIQFDPPVMKTPTKRFTLNIRHTWARRP